MSQSFPLKWPEAYPRTQNRGKSKFVNPSFFDAVKEIMHEIKLLKGTDVIVSSNVPLRADGLPYGNWERHVRNTDPGVAVYFKLRGRPMTVVCDKWDNLDDNAHAIAKSIWSMRGLERWGVSQFLERAFTGFTALPAPETWWNALGFREKPVSLERAESAYRDQIRRAHPDAGGSEQRAAKLNWAIARAREECRA